MDFAFRSRPTTAAADDEESGRLRRFPDPPPPSQPHGHGHGHGNGEAKTSGLDATLLTRRQELLLEMHKGFMHQDMILRELMETERAMGLTPGGHNYNPVSALPWSQDYGRRWAPSVPSWEAPLRQPCPCGSRSSTVVKAPPLYPHVERSSLAPEQTRPGNDAEQHQEVRSSGVRIRPFDGYFELCYSPSKQTPVSAKAGMNQMQPSSGQQQAVVWEKIGVEDVQNMQPSHEIKNQSSQGIDSAIKDCTKKPMQHRLQYNVVNQENAANNGQMSTEFNKPTPAGTSPGVKRKLMTAPSSPVKKQMNTRQDFKEEVPENRNRWTCTLCQAKCNSESDYHSHLGGRRHRENEDARFYCTACDVQCNSAKNLASHRCGRRHQATMEGSDSD